MSLTERLLPEFDHEMENTRKVLERVPEGKWDWRPHEKSMTLGGLTSHLANFPDWAKSLFETETLSLTSDYTGFQSQSTAEYVKFFEDTHKQCRELMTKASDEDLGKMWTMTWNGQTVISMPRMAVLRSMVMNHMIHHRAQLGVYLRLLNVPVPGLYGPSADEMGG